MFDLEKKHDNDRDLVLLLGTGDTSLPILKALQNLGFSVGVVGNRPTDVCHKFAYQSHLEDYTDYELVSQIFENYNYKYVVPSCSDMSYEVAARLSRDFGLPGFDDKFVIEIITNKYAFRDHLKKCGLKHPEYFHPEGRNISLPNDLKFPVIVKPLEADTGNGIQVIHDKKLLPYAIENAKAVSRDRKCLVEEFKQGTLHSVSCFIRDSKIIRAFIVDEYCTDYPYAVNESNFPSRLPDPIKLQAVADVQALIDSLGMVDGLLHVQIIFHGQKIYLIESMRRMPGDFYGKLISLSTNYAYYEDYAASFTQSEYTSINHGSSEIERFIARQTITSLNPKVFTGVSFKCAGRLIELFSFTKSGQEMDMFPADKQGIAFFEYASRKTFLREMGTLIKHNYVL